MKHPILEIHASDHDQCLRRLHAEIVDGKDTGSEAASVGTAVHRVAEQISLFRAEFPMGDIGDVATRALAAAREDLKMSAGAVLDAAEIVASLLAEDSRMDVGIAMGWNGVPEAKWSLVDVDGGLEYREGHVDGAVAAGTIDLLEWSGNEARVTDWKTKRQMLSSEDAWQDWQPRLYAYAVLRKFPDVDRVTFRYGMLRHRYYAQAEFLRGDPWEWGVERTLAAIRQEREGAAASGQWAERLGSWCAHCPIMWKCEALRKAAEDGTTVIGVLPPAELAARGLAMEKAAEKLRQAAEAVVVEGEAGLPLGDAKGTHFGFKPGEGLVLVKGYDETLAELRRIGMTREMEVEHFRHCLEHHLPGRVKKVMSALRVPKGDVLWDTLLMPITKFTVTAYVPEPKESADTLSADEFDARVRNYFN